jgi:hypothetical protein
MGFATFGVYTYGKIFVEMMKNALGWSKDSIIWLFKKFVGLFVLNKVTTKVLNGVFTEFT